jgi:hypothetical protein
MIVCKASEQPLVLRVLAEIIEKCGVLKSSRCDNGPGLTSRHFLARCIEREIVVHIHPASLSRTHMWNSSMGDCEESVYGIHLAKLFFRGAGKCVDLGA